MPINCHFSVIFYYEKLKFQKIELDLRYNLILNNISLFNMENFNKLLMLLCVFGVHLSMRAQQNVAPQATVTASTCNTGACATLNDLNFGTCGTQSMWISTGTPPSTTPGVNWIQWDWTSPKTLNKFIIHHAQTNSRFLAGARIEYWNGSAWVFVSTFSNLTPACSSVVNFPTTSTSRLRITSFTMSGTQLSNPNFREIEVFGPTYNNDAGVTAFSSLNTCTYNQSISAVVTNLGKLNLDSFRLSWSVNNVFQSTQYVNSNLSTGQSTSVVLNSSFTFSPNTVYDIRAWTDLPNGTTDSLQSNDLLLNSIDFMGAASDPTVTDFVQCGRGFPMLTATTGNVADSVFWYDNSSGGNMIGLGKTITGPFTTSTRTFYAQSAKLSKNISLQTNQTTAVNVRQTEPYGGMQTITVNKPVVLDSIQFRLYYATPINCGYQVYYKTGAHTGFLTNPSAWTKLNEGVVTYITVAGVNYGRVSTNFLNLSPGTYSFYVTTDLDFGAGNSLYSTSGGPGASNADMSILTGGNIIIGKFGSTQTLTYQPELRYIYKNQCVSVNRSPLTVTVKPTPIGASVSMGTPFQGKFRLGLPVNPDVIEVGKTLTYQFEPPTGYNNSDHGSTWFLSSVSAYTRFNVLVPSSDYTVTAPSGSTKAQLTFKPNSVWLDSLITFSVKFADLGPHYCDSTVKRTIYVAPTPKPNFTFPTSICHGDQTLFENISTIHSGVSSYKWYFGDGDSSDFNSPVHEYDAPGTYFVRLVAKSFIWDVVKDTTIEVNIGEVPLVDFKVNNACQGSSIVLVNNTVIGNGVLSYEWNFGDNSPNATTTNASKAYTIPGPYLVKLTASANGCTASRTKVVYQFARPVADYVKVEGECLNDKFKFVNNSTIQLGQFGTKWDFDDVGNIATDQNTEYSFQNAGMKNVKLLVISEFGCKDSITRLINVKQIPTTDFTYPYACDLTATPFTNTTVLNGETLLRYDWDFGTGLTSTQTNPNVSWPGTGMRNVRLRTTLTNGCKTEVTKQIVVGVQPKVDFEFENKCSGEPVSFTNLTTYSNGKVNYEWNFGDNVFSSTPSPVHLYNSGTTSQTYYVQLKASIENGCADSLIQGVTINPIPTTCDFDYERNWAVNSRNYVFTPTGGSTNDITYTWILGDGNRKTSVNSGTNYTYKGNLKYCVTMVAKNSSGCECSNTKCISITTGIDDVSMESPFGIYPNPTNGKFNIVSEEYRDAYTVNIYNSIGELIMTRYVEEGDGTFDLSEYASGVYTVSIRTENGIYNQMVTVNR